MKRFFLILVISVVTCLLIGCSNSSAPSTAQNAPDASIERDKTALEVVEQLGSGDYSSAYQHFDPKLQAALPGDKLAEVWTENTAGAGAFQNVIQSQTGERKGRKVVIVTCQFEKSQLDVQLIFNDQTQIIGLFFSETQANTGGTSVASSQVPGQNGLKFKVRRMFGLSLGSKVRSRLDLLITAPDDLKKVTFLIDDQVIDTLETPPFQISIHTDSYTPGWHQLSAVGETLSGVPLTSNVVTNQFLSPVEGNRYLFPILAGVAILVAFRIIFQLRETSKNKRVAVPLGATQSYGMAGGSICPKCERPFPFRPFSPEIIAGKLDACPHCGRFGFFRRIPLKELHQAEISEGEAAAADMPITLDDPARDLRRKLDDSRYRDC